MPYGLTIPKEEEEKVARAYGNELPISPKKSVELARLLRGKRVDAARTILEGVIDGTRAVPYRRYKMQVAHKAGMAGGGYPKRCAQAFLKVLQNAQDNAEYKGLNPEDLRIRWIAAYKGQPSKAMMQRAHGRSSNWYQETTNVEIVVQEIE